MVINCASIIIIKAFKYLRKQFYKTTVSYKPHSVQVKRESGDENSLRCSRRWEDTLGGTKT